jgi:integrase
MVREIVGHSDIEVTMTIYAHTALDEKRQALAELGNALTQPWPGPKLAVAVTVAA